MLSDSRRWYIGSLSFLGKGGGRMKPAPYRNFILLVAVALIATAGCATRRYVGPTTGRSADMQKATSMALDKAVQSASFAKYSGKRCTLEVVSLAENFGGESPENAAIRGALVEKLVRDGVIVEPGDGQSDLRLSVRARVVGVNVVRRDFPPVFYRETTTAVVDLHMTLFSRGDWKILEQRDARERLHLAQMYWLYIIGPYESLEWE